MLKYLLTHSDLASLAKLVTPELFRVLKPASLLTLFSEFNKSREADASWNELTSEANRRWSAHPLPVRIAETPTSKPLSGENMNHVVELFFFQILHFDKWLVDLSARTFSLEPGTPTDQVVWTPKPYRFQMAPEFLSGVRELYRGYYTSNPELFDQGLKALNIQDAKDALLEHFGEGDQRGEI